MDSEGKSGALAKDLVAQLQNLRVLAKEVSRIYLASLESEIVGVIELVENVDGTGKRRRKEQLFQVKKIIGDLKIKPEKGRRKDLRRIEEAVASMAKLATGAKSDSQ